VFFCAMFAILGRHPSTLPTPSHEDGMKDMRQGQASGNASLPGMPFLTSAVILMVVLIVPIINGPFVSVFGFLDRYAGVVVLVCLSNAVMFGLACTDRLVLSIRLRVLLQDIHRATAMIGLGFLAIHIIVKILFSEALAIEAVVPFIRSVPVGLGSVAGYLMVLIAALGVFRTRYLNSGRPWIWRLLHSTAYLCWPIGLVHGLSAGRAAAQWVTLSYVGCLVAVGLGLLVRLFVAPRTRIFGRSAARNAPPRRGSATSPYSSETRTDSADGSLEAEFWASLRKEVRR
jgi:hypothetical protein